MWAPGNNKPARAAGFTLLELLVALLIVGIGVSAAVLALRPDPRRPLAQEAERLGLLLQQAREEAELGGRPIAWEPADRGYRFLRRDLTENGPAWLVMQADELFHPRTLPDGMQIRSVRADGRASRAGERLELGATQQLEVELDLAGERRSLVSDAGEQAR